MPDYADIAYDKQLRRHRHSATVTADTTSDPVKIPPDKGALTVGVAPVAGGTGKVQYTLSSHAEIDADTAQWFDWDQGAVPNDTARVIDAEVTALRCVAATQNCAWEILG